MRTLLVPALAALLSLPAFASASSPATIHDDAAYASASRATFTVAARDPASNALDDAGLAPTAESSPAAAAPVRLTASNPYDDAGLRGPELAPAADAAPVRVAAQTSGCSCCQS